MIENNTIEKLDITDCCGCSSCFQRCPKNAISMKENNEGFLYPEIDKEKCVSCGLCVKACPQFKKCANKSEHFPLAYAVYNKNEDEIIKSSSGGMFSVIANYVIENNGLVIGAAFDEQNIVKHIYIEDKKNLDKLRGSKYVQSDINGMYKIAEKNLKLDKLVLFTGTPCQIAGLKSYLGKEYANLILIDVVCHGVPSPILFKKYLKYLENKYKSKIKSYEFRNKEKRGWGLTAKITTVDNKVRYIRSDNDPYYNNFLECNTYRNSCYKCHYTNFIRESNITLADYWGILSIHPNFYSEKGVSLIIVNDKRGKEIFDIVSKKIHYIETDLEKASRKNMNLKRPSIKKKRRKSIYDGLETKNETSFIKENLKIEFNLKNKIKSIVPYQVKLIVKKLGGKNNDKSFTFRK